MNITAAMVKELRQRTDAPMMECKKFLVATEGDIELAILEMRKSGQAKADKKADRVAAEGVVVFCMSDDGKRAVLVEINSETDFVARDSNFTEFASSVAQTALASGLTDIAALGQEKLVGGDLSIEETRQTLVSKLGENIQLRRVELVESDEAIGGYLHGTRIGVLVSMKQGSQALAKDLAMQVAAARPLVVRPEQVPAEEIARERDIFMAQARESGKPEAIIEKMVEGRIQKFLAEKSLLGQDFVKNPNQKISQLLKENNADVVSFVCFEVGEGIEKKVDNFVEEVMAQARES
jgi:elongation factor Ts|tara:strand:+ start:38227 stop:39108 length:882 start_codon:yes stop_codon:yes gene_type:complete